ncbi:AAA family ATPase [Candidatus Nitrosotalea bavarica]|jgi:predicted ATP-dependent endonuclease of OLD family|uniref:AAA family ATPase n=1 Tax=Candidatus Nitrosotalea bavarica TaxID=1903277 RepID=UPI000C70F70D|nr:AAA family ATPase [Candidatus Nitrosotalea bavarica]
MRLRKFRVQGYRCIHDSGEIKVGDLAAFVGRNESGKTTILEALTLLNKDTKVSDLDLCDEMTEVLKSEIKLAEGEFVLNEKETSLIREKFPNLQDIKNMKIYRTNKNPRIQYDFGEVKISGEASKRLNSWENFVDRIKSFVLAMPNPIRIRVDTKFLDAPAPRTREVFMDMMAEFNNNIYLIASQDQQVISEWKNIYQDLESIFDNMLIGTNERSALDNFIEDKLHPRFVYFSDYKKILGNIDLEEFVRESKGIRAKGLEYVEEFDKAETVNNLFYLAELDAQKLEEAKNSPSRLIKLLNISSRRLSERLNPAWKGDPIHVELRWNPGNVLSVVISDVHKDGTVTNTGLLNRRAEGFKWTFSFIVNFAAETQKAELKEAILLLDEPARNLHPAQQRGISDLLKGLAGSNQILYATHSPFMIFDYTQGNLLVVELDKRKHLSKIYYDYWNADDQTLIPILYGLSRGLVESIVDKQIGFNSRPVIIVETMSDCMYLNAFDRFLKDPNLSMNPLNIVPAYNKNSVMSLAIFYKNHGYDTFILLDNTEESRKISTELQSNEFKSVQMIFFELAGQPRLFIEDLLVDEDYLYAVNQTYEVKLRKEGYVTLTKDQVLSKGKKSILDNLNEIWKENQHLGWEKFDREEICRYICEKMVLGETDFLSDKTKDQFRSLYRLIAERIRQNQNLVSQTSTTFSR